MRSTWWPAIALAAGCTGYISGNGNGSGGSQDAGVSTDDGGEPTGAGALVSETFPDSLLQPYTGPANTDFDDTFLRYPQLQNKIKAIFNDAWIRGGVDQFAARIALFGGVDFVTNFLEARGATSDYLLAVDAMAKDVCGQATTAKTGPFATIDATAIGTGATETTKIDQLYQKVLYRSASPTELTAGTTLLSDLTGLGSTPQDAWAGLCEGLIHSQDFLFTLAPSIASTTGAAHDKLMLVRIAQDLVARPPTQAELDALANGSQTLSTLVDLYLSSNEFRDWFFNRMRIKTQSTGSVASDEPARLWTYLATQSLPFKNLFVSDYSVDPNWNMLARTPEHAGTGILSMAGFIDDKPGLPHYTYAARVLGDYMGVTFEVPASVIPLRVNATAASTVQPGTLCFQCHQILTPLAYQRGRWADDGTYQTTDAQGQAIDDSDQGLVATYPFKGEGLAAFASQAVKKEAFIRRMFDAQYLLTVGRNMRAYDDERVIYKQLWDLNVASNGDLKQIIKAIVMSPAYQAN